ncbi:replication initiator protein A [Snodgrassella sp. CFCC 13594]|uniref:replication initiator protein A n=1 Tax=Snodgrassella sp. CFCC 13594 TaxID=1775559 RepID=UPI0009EE3166
MGLCYMPCTIPRIRPSRCTARLALPWIHSFRLRKPLDRRIYELARKHCGEQPRWRISLAVLHQKSGSTGPLRRFRFDLKMLAESGNLPDYLMAVDVKRDMVTFYANGPKGKLAEVKDMLAGRSHASLAAHQKIRSPRSRGR